jgi:hypothetical protein
VVHMAGSGGMEMSIRGGGRTAGSAPFPLLVRGSVSKARLFVLDLRGARDRRANRDRFALPLFTQRRNLSPCSENIVQCAENVAPAPRYSRLTEEASEDTIKIRIKTLDDTKSWEVAPARATELSTRSSRPRARLDCAFCLRRRTPPRHSCAERCRSSHRRARR